MTPPVPSSQTATVTVGGHTYRVNSTANAEELAKLAELVDARLLALPLSQRGDPKSLVLVALGLAHDLQCEQALRASERAQTGDRLRTVVSRIDQALGHVDLDGEALRAPSPGASPTSAASTAPLVAPRATEAVVVKPSATKPTKQFTPR